TNSPQPQASSARNATLEPSYAPRITASSDTSPEYNARHEDHARLRAPARRPGLRSTCAHRLSAEGRRAESRRKDRRDGRQADSPQRGADGESRPQDGRAVREGQRGSQGEVDS